MPQLANYQEVGDPKPGATVLLNVLPPGRRPSPLLVTENYGHGRTARCSPPEEAGAGRCGPDHADKTHPVFWQQIFRYLVTDTPGQVTRPRPNPCWPTTRAFPSAWRCATRNTSP